MIADATGSRPLGWSSPSVYSNGDTPEAVAAEGVAYTLDQMDSDIVQRLKTPEGPLHAAAQSGGHRRHGPGDSRGCRGRGRSRRWLHTAVVIGIHPFVVGTPDGAAAIRRVLLRLKQEDLVWLTDKDAMRKAAGMD
jgi:allantoinase